MKKYYRVRAKCGHVGNNKYIPIDFYYMADNAKIAAELCRNTPRVKHHHKDAIIETVEITKADYENGLTQNRKDPYLSVNNIQDQRRVMSLIIDRVKTENDFESLLPDDTDNNNRNYLGKKHLNKSKKFIQRYQQENILFEEIQDDIPTAFRKYFNAIATGNIIATVTTNTNTNEPLSEGLYNYIGKNCKSPDEFVKKMKVFFNEYYKTCEKKDSLEFGVVIAYYIHLLEKIDNGSNNVDQTIDTILKMIYRFKDKLDLEYFENCLFDYRAYEVAREMSTDLLTLGLYYDYDDTEYSEFEKDNSEDYEFDE